MPGITSSLSPEYSVAFREWLSKPVGKHFLDLECKSINTIVPTLFGYYALVLGEPNFQACMQQSSIGHKFLINNDLTVLTNDICKMIHARQDRLPVGTALIDVVYLAHCLEFAANPHEVLREAYRVLRADGHLLISIFNPLSMWGCWRTIAKFGSKAPWKANFMSVAKLQDWLALLGFDIIRIKYFGFNLPLNRCKDSTNLSLLEKYGQRLNLPFGAAYLIEASKRVIPLTPVVPVWRAEPDIIEDDITEPTA